MALNRFERWTRRVLELEARKRGIRDPEVRSHAELARMILRHDYASTHSLRSARKLVGAWFESAGAALPLARERTPQPLERAAVPYGARQPHAATPEPIISSTAASERAAATADAQRRAVAAQRFDKLEQAAEAAAVAAETQPFTFGPERLEYSRPEPRELHLRWQISEQGKARARALLGERGELAVRIVSVRADPAHVIQSDITEHGPVENRGEWTAQLASEDTYCVSAVGLRNAGQFVSIVHRSSRPKPSV